LLDYRCVLPLPPGFLTNFLHSIKQCMLINSPLFTQINSKIGVR
jgi:hypothetical protein